MELTESQVHKFKAKYARSAEEKWTFLGYSFLASLTVDERLWVDATGATWGSYGALESQLGFVIKVSLFKAVKLIDNNWLPIPCTVGYISCERLFTMKLFNC